MAHIAKYEGKRRTRWRAETCVNLKRRSKVFPTEAQARAWADKLEAKGHGMPALRKALEDHSILHMLPLKFRDAVQRANFTETEILASSFNVECLSGVYFLIRDETIIYVGQTKDVLDRIRRHRGMGKQFTSVAFIPAPMDQLDELETIYIRLLMPELNAKGI